MLYVLKISEDLIKNQTLTKYAFKLLKLKKLLLSRKHNDIKQYCNYVTTNLNFIEPLHCNIQFKTSTNNYY